MSGKNLIMDLEITSGELSRYYRESSLKVISCFSPDNSVKKCILFL